MGGRRVVASLEFNAPDASAAQEGANRHATLLASDIVLKAALEELASKQPSMRERLESLADPVRWLSRRLKVEVAPDRSVVNLEMQGDMVGESVLLLRAVIAAYQAEAAKQSSNARSTEEAKAVDSGASSGAGSTVVERSAEVVHAMGNVPVEAMDLGKDQPSAGSQVIELQLNADGSAMLEGDAHAKIRKALNQARTNDEALGEIRRRQPYRIGPGDTLLVRTYGELPDRPEGQFTVEDEGTIALGPFYGRVDVAGLSVREAEAAVLKLLTASLKDVVKEPPKVQVTLGRKAAKENEHPPALDPRYYSAAPGATPVPATAPDGTVVGPLVAVADHFPKGVTEEAAEKIVAELLQQGIQAEVRKAGEGELLLLIRTASPRARIVWKKHIDSSGERWSCVCLLYTSDAADE